MLRGCGHGHREGGGVRAFDACAPITKQQPHPVSHCLARLPLQPLPHQLLVKIWETLSGNMCRPWGPSPHLPNIWTCSREPFISGNFFPHLICLFKENKLLLIRNTAFEMCGPSQAADLQTFCLI